MTITSLIELPVRFWNSLFIMDTLLIGRKSRNY